MNEVCLFESPRVIFNGREVVNLAPREQNFLTTLAMNAGKPVSHDQISRALHGTEYSRERDSGYRALVSRTRKKCGDEEHSRIAKVSGGYLLAVDASDVDVLRFRSAWSAGSAAANANDWSRALGHLALGRGLWTGEPYFYSRVPYLRVKYEQTLKRELTGLLTQHAEAVIRVMLPHASDSVIPDLKSLLAKDRSNQRLCCLHMLALYRSGNDGKATEYYAKTERLLVNRFGTGPDRYLRNLYQLIVDEDERLLQTPLPLPPFSSEDF